ncbi:diguanylate cyclase [Alteromonas genovensis]|uniref:diguanylate cyclase n=1 Tax=Alteromonas genovensis TaxID=471225 RepID=A0A6N9TH32_9ALTE|nr:diguanylate cyclase [Alteromonas genovensis]
MSRRSKKRAGSIKGTAVTSLCHFANKLMLKCVLMLLITSPSLASGNDVSMKNQVDAYANLAHAVLYEWNYPSELTNKDIAKQLQQSGIQSDNSEIAVVFRHIMALSNVEHQGLPQVPITVKRPLLEKNWLKLKSIDLRTYVYLKAYYFYVKGVSDYKGSLKRLSTTIPSLYNLKQEILQSGDKRAVAMASMWLAEEYSTSSPIRSINEMEYAIPFLAVPKNSNKLEKEFNLYDAHRLLSESYLDLNLPSKAVEHAKEYIYLKKQHSTLDTVDFLLAITALNRLSRFAEALALIEDAKKYMPSVQDFKSIYVDLLLMSIYSSRLAEGDTQKITELANRILSSAIDMPAYLTDAKPIAKAMYIAVNGSDSQFDAAIREYEKAFEKKFNAVPYKKTAILAKFQALKHIYAVRGDSEKAFANQNKYSSALVNYHTERFQLNDNAKLSMLSRDVELAEYRQKELEALQRETSGLAGETENLRTAVFALIAIICSILTTWLWIAKRKSDTKADTDSLTGALTRRAMLRQLKSLLRKHPTSCIALIDIDHFKRINDKYGHAVGDEVLNTFSQTILKRIRKSDLLCRYGGEEFLIYFENSSEQEVKSVLNELNDAFSRVAHWKHTDKAFTVSFSSGVVALNGSVNSESVIKTCDDLLYKAKNSGRSRVESATLALA